MDIEQLKLILETLEGAGEGAYTMGLLWVVKSYFLGILWASVVLVVFRWVCVLIGKSIEAETNKDMAYRRLEGLAGDMGVHIGFCGVGRETYIEMRRWVQNRKPKT